MTKNQKSSASPSQGGFTPHLLSLMNIQQKNKMVKQSKQPFIYSKIKKSEGFIALISILIVGGLILTVSIGVSLRSIGETEMSFGEQESNKALALANLCAEQALMKLESILNYSGSESIIVGGSPCDILAIDGSGNLNRTVKSQSTVSGYTRKVKVEVSQISPTMRITSWEEISDF